MNRSIIPTAMRTLAVTALGAALLSSTAPAADVYWNNTSLNWNTSTATWNTAADNSGTTQVWNNGDNAIFSAGTALTGSYTLTSGGVTVDNITQQEGRIRVSSSTLTLADTAMTIDTQTRVSGDYDLRIDSVIANSGAGASSITKEGVGVLMLTGNNTFTGGVTINAGAVYLETQNNAFGSGTLTLSGGNLAKSYGTTTLTIANPISVSGTINVGSFLQSQQGDFNLTGNWSAGSTSSLLSVSNVTLSGLTTLAARTIRVSGNISSYVGTFQHNATTANSGANRLRFGPLTTGSTTVDGSNAKFITTGSTATSGANPIDLGDNVYGTFKMGELSGTGGIIRAGWATGGNTTFEIGYLNTSSTYAGSFQNNINGAGGYTLVTKVGTGSLTLSGPSTYSQTTTVRNGALVASAAVSVSATSPFGNASSAIALGDATSISDNLSPSLFIGGAFTMARTVTVGSSGAATTGIYTLGGSTANSATFSGAITLNQSVVVDQVTGGTLAISGAIGGGGALTKTGDGTVTLSGANNYSGNTTVSVGTLALSGSGTLASPSVVIDSGATFDVSAQTTPTLAANQSLRGNGSVNGSLTTASTSKIYPGTDGTDGALTFNNALTMTSGSTFDLDVSPSASSGNDAVSIGGALTLNNNTFNVRALSGAADLQQTDFLLVSAGSISGSPNPAINWVGTPPNNAANFTVVVIGTDVVLQYNATSAPTVSASIAPATVVRGQDVTITAVVTPGSGAVTNVSVDVSSIGGSSTASLVLSNNFIYTNTFTVGSGTTLGGKTLAVSVTDDTPLSGGTTVGLTIVAQTWSGGAGDDNWSSGANWVSGSAPTLSGEDLTFTGSTRTTPSMDGNYSAASLSFDSGASSFTIGTSSSTLTLTGGVTNSSANLQTLNVPVSLSAATPFNAASGNLTVSGAISGSGGVTKSGANTLTLSVANSFTGGTTISAGALKLGHANAVQSSTVTNSTANGLAFDTGIGTFDVGGLAGGSSQALTDTGSSAVTLSVGGNNSSSTYSGALSGSGSLTKTGSGTLTLSGQNSQSGGTTVNDGALELTAGGQVGAIRGTLNVNSGGTVSCTVANALGWGSGTRVQQANVVGGLLATTGAGDQGWNLTYNLTGGELRANGGTSDSSSASFFVLGRDNLISGGACGVNTLASGSSSVISGRLNLRADSGQTSVTFNVADGAAATDLLVSAAITQQSGNVGINKAGAGTMTLSGANIYTGATTVSNGTLLVSGSLASGSAVTVEGGTLGGTGAVNGAVTVNSSGALAPGAASIGTLTLGSLSLNSGATAAMEIGDGPTGDKAAASGAVAYGGTLKLIWTGTTPAAGTVDLFDGSGFSGAFSSLQVSNWPSAFRVNTNNLTTDGTIAIAANASPVARNLTNGVAQGDAVTLKIIGGKNGPTDADGDTLTVATVNLVTPANGGNVSITGGTSVVYTASSSFSGTDSYTYTVSDLFGATDTKTVTVIVSPANTGANITGISGSSPTITVTAQGVPSALYQLQYTTNVVVVSWQDVSGVGGTNTASASTGAMIFTDVNATNSQAWYRTRYVSGP